MHLKPKDQATLTQAGTLRRIISHGEFIYTLTDKGLTGEIRKLSRRLTPVWGKATPFSVNDMTITNEGIVISGHQYSKGNEGTSISAPMVAKMNLKGEVDWQRVPRPPREFVPDWQGEITPFDPNDSAQFWKILLLPGGSVISMGLLNQQNGQILYHHRFDPHGRTIWSKACATVKTDWMYTYPGKVEPLLARHKEWLYHFGAYRIHSKTSYIAGFKIHIRSGEVVQRYLSDNPQHIFSGGALSLNGDCAIGALGPAGSPATILALDSNFKLKGELTTSLQPWTDLIWIGTDEIAYTGGININSKSIKKPGFERFIVRNDSVSRPQLFQDKILSGFARLSKNHHAFVAEDEKGRNHLTVRRLVDGANWQMSSPALNHLQIDDLDDGGAIIGLNNMGADLTLIRI